MLMKKFLLPIVFPVALLGAASAAVWFGFISGWNVATQWLEQQVEELP